MSEGTGRSERIPSDSSRYWVAGYPELVAQWHPERNGRLRPESVSYGSGARIWWKCAEGPDHEWVATPNNRTALGQGCPFCAGRKVSVTNSLASRFPELAAEWHRARNGKLTPSTIVAGSTRRVWWRCAAGHAWCSAPRDRARGMSQCPFCRGLRAAYDNSLEAFAPDLAAEWHPTKNEMGAADVTVGSSRRVWWRCARDPSHEWAASVTNRVRAGAGCPFCAGQRVTPERSLVARAPDVAREWHPTRNASLRAEDVSYGSRRKAWWMCARGHEWVASVGDRAGSRQAPCPECARQDREGRSRRQR